MRSHPVERAGELGDVVVAAHLDAPSEVGLADRLCRLTDGADRAKQPAGDEPRPDARRGQGADADEQQRAQHRYGLGALGRGELCHHQHRLTRVTRDGDREHPVTDFAGVAVDASQFRGGGGADGADELAVEVEPGERFNAAAPVGSPVDHREVGLVVLRHGGRQVGVEQAIDPGVVGAGSVHERGELLVLVSELVVEA